MSSDPVLSDLQLIQDWIDQHPVQESNPVPSNSQLTQGWIDHSPARRSDQLLNHNDNFNFDQLCEIQSLHQSQAACDFTQIWECDATQTNVLYCQPATLNGGYGTLEDGCAMGTSTRITGSQDAYDHGASNPQIFGYDHGNPTWIVTPKDVFQSIENVPIRELDELQNTQRVDQDIARRMELMETELKSVRQQLVTAENDLNSLHKWAGHMSYVVNEMQLCQRGFSPIIKTFGILLPQSLRPPQDSKAGDDSE